MLSTVFSSVSEFTTFLLQSFRLSFVLPALIFNYANIYALPYLLEENEIARAVSGLPLNTKLAYIIAASLILGYFLSIINIWLIKLYEGYHWKDFFPGTYLVKAKRREYESILRLYEQKNVIPRSGAAADRECESNSHFYQQKSSHSGVGIIGDQSHLKSQQVNKHKGTVGDTVLNQYIRENYPVITHNDINDIVVDISLPTSLGNVISAFEAYPKDRYDIDAVTMWPRLLPILTQHKYALYIEREKAALDFLLNLSFLTLLLGIEVFYIGIAFATDTNIVLWISGACGLLVVSYWLYKLSILSASGWGSSVKTAFDLYRYHLLASLFVKAPNTYSDERAKWEGLSLFFQGSDGYLQGRQPGSSYNPVFEYKTIDLFMKQYEFKNNSKEES